MWMVFIMLIAVVLSMVPFWLVRVYRYARKITIVNGRSLTLSDGNVVRVSQEYLDQYHPAAGGYYVMRVEGEDAYQTAAEFEQGYVVTDF